MSDEHGMNRAPLDPMQLARVAEHALKMVADGMILGLGSGRTSEAFIQALGERVRRGLRVKGVPTSVRSEELARKQNIEIVGLDEVDRDLDVAFDGADEVASDLSLTKGAGGAMLRERVIAYQAERFVVLVTPEKIVEKLGSRMPIPVEVVPFASPWALRHLRAIGGDPVIRKKEGGVPYVTDNHNWIADVTVPPIDDPAAFDAKVRKVPGVVDTGIFIGMADVVLVVDAEGVRELK